MNTFRAIRRAFAFTLVELLVVIAIMLVLMGFLLAGASRLRTNAMIEASKAMSQALVTAVETYSNDYRAYPILYPDIPGTVNGILPDLYNNASFKSQFWDNSTNYWKPAAANATLVYQMLMPKMNGPYLNPSSASVPLLLPLNASNQKVTISFIPTNETGNMIIRLACDKFENPLNVTWVAKVMVTAPVGGMLVGKTYWGTLERSGAVYTLTAHDKSVVTFTPNDIYVDQWSTPNAHVLLTYTGLKVWSSGPDGLPHTSDDDTTGALAGH